MVNTDGHPSVDPVCFTMDRLRFMVFVLYKSKQNFKKEGT